LTNPSGGRGTEDDFDAAISRIIAAGKAAGVPTGLHALDLETAKRRIEQGMQFIALASDVRFMATKAADFLEVLRPQGNGRLAVGY
jgi:4-hydroxy-2-oxoheptanedioate aldolase